MGFRFQRFIVEDRQSTQRVGTDALILGAWAEPANSAAILDIGTGCGVLALMLAQKSEAIIDAVDIDEASIAEAQKNFESSPWHLRMRAIRMPVADFSANTNSRYDFIISNPPFFGNSLKSPSSRKNRARHDTDLSHDDLISAVTALITPGGKFCVVLPYESCDAFIRTCGKSGLSPGRETIVYPKPGANPKRVLLEFSPGKMILFHRDSLTILDGEGRFTQAYLALTAGYHQF